MVRLASAPQPKPLVVRVDEVGRAEAVAYEAMEAQADPLDPTTRFVVDHYSRRRGTVREYTAPDHPPSNRRAPGTSAAQTAASVLREAGSSRTGGSAPTATVNL